MSKNSIFRKILQLRLPIFVPKVNNFFCDFDKLSYIRTWIFALFKFQQFSIIVDFSLTQNYGFGRENSNFQGNFGIWKFSNIFFELKNSNSEFWFFWKLNFSDTIWDFLTVCLSKHLVKRNESFLELLTSKAKESFVIEQKCRSKAL